MSTPRPNILFALADDASHFSAYGHRFLHTPHFDRVAHNGVRFERMFTTNPKCAPSRASLLTGRHTWQLGAACTHYCYFPGPEAFDVYPDLLEAAGYHVGYTGKGWAPGDWEREGRTRNPAGPEYSARSLDPPPDSKIKPIDYAGNFADFLDARPAADAPFCFWYGGIEPHRPYRFGESLRPGRGPADLDPAAIAPYWPDDDTVRTDLLDYAFETEWFDAQLGKMLDQLERRGELDNTLVVVTSDNGCPFPRVKGQMYDDDFRLPFAAMWPGRVKGGRVCEDLCSFVDVMPTFLDVAGVAVPPGVAGGSLTDVLLSDKSGWITDDRRRAYMGRERHDLGREGDRGYPVRCVRTERYLYVHNFAPDRWPAGNPETGFTNCDPSPTKTRVLKLHEEGDPRWFNLAFGKRPAEELFDLDDDPHCMTNLANQPEHAEVQTSLRNDLMHTLAKTDDPRSRGEGDVFDTYDYVGHDTAAHSWKAYIEGWGRPASS